MSLLEVEGNSKSVLESISSLGIESVFGCLEESLFSSSGEVKVNFVQLKHEQAAVHAADGFARATGKPGVVILNTPSGLTNGITGIATAYSDSVPLLVFAGPLFSSHQDAGSFEGLNISGVTMPITKHIFKIESIDDLLQVIPKAFALAASGRPGPVLIEFARGKTVNQPAKSFVQQKRADEPQAHIGNNESVLIKAMEYIESARKPVFLIGGGTIISGAAECLKEIVQQCRIPVASTLMGIGAFDSANPLFLGMVGMHGTFAANKALHQCDLLISIGVRFSDRVTGKISGFSPKSKIIHVDIDPSEINKIIQVDLPIVSDAADFLKWLKDHLNVPKVREHTEIWVNEASEWKRTVPRFDKSNTILSPQNVIQMLDQYSAGSAIVVTDVGQHQIWTAHNYKFTRPRTLLTSGGLGTMGYGLPAAIGASISSPEKLVICVSGDGSFQMNLQEMMTAVKYNLSIKIAILNNGYLGMVRQWQQFFYNERYSSVKISSPDFAKLAGSYGAAGYKARTEEEARKVIIEAFKAEGPALMEFDVTEEENVFPMVLPNTSNYQTLLSREK